MRTLKMLKDCYANDKHNCVKMVVIADTRTGSL